MTYRSGALFCGLLLAALGISGCSQQNESKESRLKSANEDLLAGQFQKAEQKYREALRADPADPEATRQLGIIYFDQGQLAQAYPLLKKSAELDPSKPEVQLRLGQTLLAGRQYRQARDAALRVLEKQPGDEQALVMLADTAVEPKDIEEVASIVAGLRAKDQDRAGYHLALGALEMRKKDFTSAENEFKAAVKLDEKSSLTHAALGALYMARNDRAGAESAFKAAADLAPVRSAVRLRYPEFKLATGASAEAKKILEDLSAQAPDYLPPRALLMKIACVERRDQDCAARVQNVLAQDPINHDALFQDGLINLDKGDATKAIREFEMLSNSYANDAAARYQLAVAYLEYAKTASPVNMRNAIESADSKLNEALKISPNFPQATLLSAELKIRKNTPAAAVDLLTPLVKQYPQIPQAHYLLATAYLAQSQRDRALAEYRQMSELFPKDPQPPFLTGALLLGQQQNAEARQQFEKSVAISADFLPAVEALANLDLTDKNYASALERVQKVVDKNPKQAQAFALRGKIYLAQRDFAHAEPDLEKAIELDPNLEPAYLLLTQLYLGSNRQDQALDQLKSLVEKNKDDKDKSVSPLLRLAMLQQALKRFDAARDTYEKLLAIAPNVAAAQNNLAFLYSEQFNQLDKAYDLAKKANEAAPNEPHIADTFGLILLKKGEYKDALRLLQDSASKLPDSADVQFHVGVAHYMLGQESEARSALEKAVNTTADFAGKDEARRRLTILALNTSSPTSTAQGELDAYLRERPNDPVALLRRAQLQERQGNADQAVKTYEAIIQSNPQFAPVFRRLAIAYARSNQLAKASDVAQKARQAYPDDPQVADALGWVQLKNGEYDKALALLKDSASKLTEEPEAQFHLGMAYYMLGQQEPARAELQKAVNATADFPDKVEARRRLELLSFQDSAGLSSAARPQLESFLREYPNDPFAQFQLARLQEQGGAADQAIIAYEKILASNPGFSPALRQLVALYGHNTPPDLNKAFEITTRARGIFPEDAEITRTLGVLNYRRNRYPQAAEQLKAAAANRKDDAELLYYLAETYHQLKQPRECQEAIDSALKLNLPAQLAEQAKRVQADCVSAGR